MGSIQVLDCTLRDGGYCNDCQFGFENQKKIVNSLMEANIDVIECGFFMDQISFDRQRTRFSSLDQVRNLLPAQRDGKLFVVLADHGKFDPGALPTWDGSSVDGLRIAFHKKDRLAGLEDCRAVREKGYKVFVQAMVSVSYTDEEFLDLIRRVNDVEPYAFYIVDSFGMMKQKDLTRLFYMVEHNLSQSIRIGFHSHNNMQLAYSNAQSLVHMQTQRDLIIDSSVYGMGRGAGNLNTELFVEYLNENAGGRYELKPLLAIIDQVLSGFYERNPWGYSLPNYLSAKHNAHPNYAGYLDAKKTLTAESMDEIFQMMDESKKVSFDREYIGELYTQYMAAGQVQESRLAELREKIQGKSVLIVAPGRSCAQERDKIIRCARNQADVSISVNFRYEPVETDFIFLSNLRRFRELGEEDRERCIVTSNIPSMGVYLQTQYRSLLNGNEAVRDNAGMMLVKLLISLGARKIYMAGLDGYSTDPSRNFADEKMNFYTRKAIYQAMNAGMTQVLGEYKKQVEIEFVTTPRFVVI